jgi:AraC-like DNA-binding protein
MYLCEGSLSVTLDDGENRKSFPLHPGQLLVFYPHRAFTYDNETCGTGGAGGSIRYLWFHLTGYGAAGLLSECSIPVGSPCTVGFPEEAEEEYRSLFRAFLIGGPCMDTAVCACAMKICAMFGHILSCGAAEPAGRNGTGMKRLYTSVSYIHEHLSESLTVPALAAMEHLGPSRYRALFREATGLSPSRYITVLRMRRAAELLLNTDLPVTAVSASVGYDDPLYFSRMFYRESGFSPTVYRKRNR